MNNSQIVHLLRSISAAYEVKKKNRFKIIAYDRAASAVDHATSELKDLWDEGKLKDIPGIGEGIASHFDELFRTGKVKHFEEILKDLPPAMFELIKVPGIGPKSAFKICQKLKIKNEKGALENLRKAALVGKIRVIEGFGKQSEKEIIEGLGEFGRKTKRLLLPFASQIADDILEYLSKCPQVIKAYPLGSLRRGCATVGDVDIAVASRNTQKVIDWFVKYPKKTRLVEAGEAKASIVIANEYQVDLRVQAPDSFGALLQHFTGSKQHNIHLREIAIKKGWSLSEYGIKKKDGKIEKFSDEKNFYKALGMEWIPPELREDKGEVEAALENKLPKLVDFGDIRGDLHLHSNFDIETSHDLGKDLMEDMVKKAIELGYEYLAFAEHNPSSGKHRKEQFISLLKRKKKQIDDINYSSEKSVKNRGKKLYIFNSLEIDIKPNGQRAIPDEALEILDFAIVAVHSAFKIDKERMTQRILRAFDHPKVKILAHPTGRLLNKREGYELDWDKIFKFCLKKQKFLEINALPDRLDLPDVVVKEAVKRGVKLVIGSDAHGKDNMKLLKFGIFVARRGWAKRNDIINTLGYNQIKSYLI